MTRMAWLWSAAAALVLLTGTPALAREKPALESSATAGAQRQDGLLPVYVDKAKGRIPL